MNFKLKTPKSKDSSLILSYVTLSNGNRFVYSTGEKIPLRLWDTNSQLPKQTKSQVALLKQLNTTPLIPALKNALISQKEDRNSLKNKLIQDLTITIE